MVLLTERVDLLSGKKGVDFSRKGDLDEREMGKGVEGEALGKQSNRLFSTA